MKRMRFGERGKFRGMGQDPYTREEKNSNHG